MKNLKSTFTFISILLMISVFGIISSCKDDTDEEAPVIDLEEPLTHGHYFNGDMLHFHGDVTDNEEVEHVEITVWEESDSTNPLFSVHLHPATASFHIDTGFMVATTDTTEYMFKVVAEDAAGNTSETPGGQHVHINE